MGEKINEYKSLKANTVINKKEELKTNTRKIVGTNVERIRHKYETGCNFRHSDVEMK
ncbi:hypothetical protein [Wolbachia endosymbiont of Wuchereria bancrofti]|uniref:hypothetical protein n=1 Tax=Wolbachia endosymbiont of Wuchereria bancrofti TaxID=96496 RepID=UPI0015CF8D42|nr:hypothetical protein [Wolbachia endosymbiont of Wuchereria bancrofti]